MDSNRRQFFSAALAAAPLYIPKSAFGANDRLVYGVIATGGRGRYLNSRFQKLGAQCAALCDVYEPYLERAQEEMVKEGHPEAKTYTDYRDVLSRKDIDAVVIASPDHHHCPMLLDSLEAGKDVYLEKPLSKSLEESERMIKAVRKHKQVVQIGMQRRSAPAIIAAKKLVDEGILGRISMVRPQWHWNISAALDNSPLPGKLDWKRFLGSAPNRPLEPMRFRKWRYFWDYAGGNMTDQGTHLMDVVQWFTNQGPPQSAICHGYVANMKGAEHPDVFTAAFEYPDMMVTWTLNYNNAYENGWSILFQGDKGTLLLDEAGYKIWAEPWHKQTAPIHEEKAPVPIEAHIQNFLDCVRSRQEPNCTVEIAARAVAGPHLANLALRKKMQVRMAT